MPEAIYVECGQDQRDYPGKEADTPFKVVQTHNDFS
jgi:hypothetical protein